MSELNKPEISPDFTIDDIHKVREWNYERRKNMTPEEVSADIKRGADAFLELLKPTTPLSERSVSN